MCEIAWRDSRAIVAVAVLLLVEEMQFRLGDSVDPWLPEPTTDRSCGTPMSTPVRFDPAIANVA